MDEVLRQKHFSPLPDIEGIDGAGNFKEYIRWWFNLSYQPGGESNALFELKTGHC